MTLEEVKNLKVGDTFYFPRTQNRRTVIAITKYDAIVYNHSCIEFSRVGLYATDVELYWMHARLMKHKATKAQLDKMKNVIKKRHLSSGKVCKCVVCSGEV